MKKLGYDLGRKPEKMEACTTINKNKNQKNYPSFSLSEDELPYLDDLEVGDKISLISLYEITRKEKVNDEPCRYSINLIKVVEEPEGALTKAFEKKLKDFFGEHKEVKEETETEENKEE